MATLAIDTVEIFGTGVLEAEGVVIDKDGNAWGGGRNGKVYKVSPDGKVHEVAQLPPGSIPGALAAQLCQLRCRRQSLRVQLQHSGHQPGAGGVGEACAERRASAHSAGWPWGNRCRGNLFCQRDGDRPQ